MVKQPLVYKVLDDYNRTASPDRPLVVPGLNCDTAVRSSLDAKQAVQELEEEIDDNDPLLGGFDDEPDCLYHEGFTRLQFNITEDQSVDEREVQATTEFEDITPLLYSPLPRRLPALKQKDLLVNIAASEGNIDRYVRLRRPFSVPQQYLQVDALVRGIYHHPLFAKWCSMQPEFLFSNAIQNAITARYIMCNDVSRVNADTRTYQIWYPSWASSETYGEVLCRCPSMRQSVARAGIVTGDVSLFSAADPDPSDRYLGIEAKASPNPWFMEELTRRASAQGKQVNTDSNEYDLGHIPARDKTYEHRPGTVPKDLNDCAGFKQHGTFSIYDGCEFNIAPVAASAIATYAVKNHPMFKDSDYLNSMDLFPGSVRLEFFEEKVAS